eukprot:450958-Pyramimonas_sp.AAC.1
MWQIHGGKNVPTSTSLPQQACAKDSSLGGLTYIIPAAMRLTVCNSPPTKKKQYNKTTPFPPQLGAPTTFRKKVQIATAAPTRRSKTPLASTS